MYQTVTVHSFSLERGTKIFNSPEKYGITQIDYTDLYDSLQNDRLGYSYEVASGMTQRKAKEFTEMAKGELSKE